jgi:hypothetical protein
MGIFGNIKDAKYSDGGVYLKKGVYRLEILKVLYKKTRQQKDAFIAEFKVIDSTNTELLPGCVCSWMVTLDKEPALGNIKQFLAEALGCQMEQITEQIVEAVINESGEKANPLGGKFIRAAAVDIMTKAGRPFTKVKFIRDAAGAAAAQEEHAKG